MRPARSAARSAPRSAARPTPRATAHTEPRPEPRSAPRTPGVAALLAMAALVACGDAAPDPGTPEAPAAPLDRDEAEVRWSMEEVDQLSEGCDDADAGCARARIVWPAFEGTDPAPRAAAAWVDARIRERGLLEGDIAPSAEALARDFVAAYDAFRADFPGGASFGWALEREIGVEAASRPVLLLQASEMAYTGGAHPNHWVRYHALHLPSGRTLDLEALLDPEAEAPVQALLEAAYRRDAGLPQGAPLTDAGLFDDRIPLVDNVEPTPEGLTFHYNPYAIGPYSMGMIRIRLSWDEVEPHLRSQARDDLAAWLAPPG